MVLLLVEPPYTERYVRWCGRGEAFTASLYPIVFQIASLRDSLRTAIFEISQISATLVIHDPTLSSLRNLIILNNF